jgi:hypothetical protein
MAPVSPPESYEDAIVRLSGLILRAQDSAVVLAYLSIVVDIAYPWGHLATWQKRNPGVYEFVLAR